MTHYTLAVGSTATYRAHDDESRIADILATLPLYASHAVTGVWDDVPEDTMLYTLELSSRTKYHWQHGGIPRMARRARYHCLA